MDTKWYKNKYLHEGGVEANDQEGYFTSLNHPNEPR
jgi:hypothetical protein